MGWRDKVAKRYNELILEDAPPMGYMNGNTTSNPLGMDDLLAAEKEFKKFLDGSVGLPSPEILIMTEEHWKILREQSPEAISTLAAGNASGVTTTAEKLLGIPVEVYPTQEECRARAFLLLDEGKRVGLVEDNPNGSD